MQVAKVLSCHVQVGGKPVVAAADGGGKESSAHAFLGICPVPRYKRAVSFDFIEPFAQKMGAGTAASPIPQFGEPIPVPASSDPVLELIDFHAANVEPRLGGQLMKALAAAAPLDGLPHVKRIRKVADSQPPVLHILLCPVDWKAQQQAGQDCGSDQAGEQQQAAGDAEQQNHAHGGCQSPELPPAVMTIAEQHGLQPFIAQVRAAWHLLPGGLCSAGPAVQLCDTWQADWCAAALRRFPAMRR
jgi:hypothetical protein